MSETLEVRTVHSQIGDAVQELAEKVDDVSICLPSPRAIGEGEWVRFIVRLRDGTAVLEGVGRCQSVKKVGSEFDLLLSLLQFDERNEIMYERVLIARDTDGPITGMVDIAQVAGVPPTSKPASAAPAQRPPTTPPVSAKSIPPPPRTPSVAPPKPAAFPAAKAKPAPERARAAPVPSPNVVAKPDPAPTPKAAAKPAPPKSEAPLPPALAKPVPPQSEAPPAETNSGRPERSTDRPPKRKRKGLEVPAEDAATMDTIVSRPADLAPRAQGPIRIEVAAHLVARARALAPTLPRAIARPEPGTTAEEAVLQAAVRIGMAALAALADAEDQL